jgi:hypothetical protein
MIAANHHTAGTPPVPAIVATIIIGVATLVSAAGIARYWVAGQGMGQFWSGITTDPNAAPLIVLLGVAVLGSAPWRRHRMR